jgi:CRP-like cAMP-binding protein
MIAIMFAEIDRFLAGLPRRDFTFRTGEVVFRLGDPIDRLHFVTSGTINLVRHQSGGAPIILQRVQPGAVLAEASLYSERYHCDAVAITEARTWALAKEQLLLRLTSNAEFGQAWAQRLAHELQRARFQVEVVAMNKVAERLDAWIAAYGPMPPKGEWVRLAAEIGVTPEALYREIAKRHRRAYAALP